MTLQETSSNSANGRKSSLRAKIRELLVSISGIEFKENDDDRAFLELGMDSLLLTQVATKLTNEFKTPVKFRQLVDDLSTISLLCDFMDKSLPPDMFAEEKLQGHEHESVYSSVGAPSQPADTLPLFNSASSVQSTQLCTDGNVLARTIAQQLKLMSRQLELLTGKVGPQSPGIEKLTASLEPARACTNTVSSNGSSPTVAEVQVDEKKKFVGPALRIHKGDGEALSVRQQRHLKDLIGRYTQRTKSSKEFAQAHRRHLADPRTVAGFKPQLKEAVYQIVVNKSHGSKIWDIDGNEYIDLLNGFGSNFFGHRAPFVMHAIEEQLKLGIEIGPQHPLAGELAEELAQYLDFDRVAFCNTGSEAVLGAVRISRTVTGRNKIVMFAGSYHGIFDEVIVRGTKSLRSIPAAPGIQPGAVENIIVLDYGTQEALEIIRKNINDLAAVLVEPVQSRLPEFQPKEFLKALRSVTEEFDVPLIFDEVVTGFRTGQHGAQGYFEIKADLATYGKVLGGGMNIGLIAGKSKYMDALDGGFWQFGDSSIPEVGVTYFAGTFVRHPPALAAAKAVLHFLKEQGPQLYSAMNSKTDFLVSSLNAFFEKMKAPLIVTNFASVMRIGYTSDIPFGEILFLHLREKGIHVWDHRPSFLTIAHSENDVAHIIDAFKQSVKEMRQGDFLPDLSDSFSEMDASKPPLPNARLGKDLEGNPAWFVPDPDRPGKFLLIGKDS